MSWIDAKIYFELQKFRDDCFSSSEKHFHVWMRLLTLLKQWNMLDEFLCASSFPSGNAKEEFFSRDIGHPSQAALRSPVSSSIVFPQPCRSPSPFPLPTSPILFQVALSSLGESIFSSTVWRSSSFQITIICRLKHDCQQAVFLQFLSPFFFVALQCPDILFLFSWIVQFLKENIMTIVQCSLELFYSLEF